MSVPIVRLTITREWVLYAFPPEVVPTDPGAVPLSEAELGQIIEASTRALARELEETRKKLAVVLHERDALLDANAERLRDQAVAQMSK